MDWSSFPFVEHFTSDKLPKREDWKMGCFEVKDILQMSGVQAMGSMLCLLRGWALDAVFYTVFGEQHQAGRQLLLKNTLVCSTNSFHQ